MMDGMGPIPSTEGAAPDSGQTFVPSPDVDMHLADIATDRAAGWRLCTELVSPPTSTFVRRLRDGEIPAMLIRFVAWFGEDSKRFLAPRLNLETFARSSRHRQFDDDVATMSAEYSRLWPDGLEWRGEIRSLIDQIDQEARAWRRGDQTVAKQLRIKEQQHIESALINAIPEWAAQTDVSTTSIVYRTIARILVLYLSFESGRDFDATLYGRRIQPLS